MRSLVRRALSYIGWARHAPTPTDPVQWISGYLKLTPQQAHWIRFYEEDPRHRVWRVYAGINLELLALSWDWPKGFGWAPDSALVPRHRR